MLLNKAAELIINLNLNIILINSLLSTAVACVLNGLTDEEITVKLLGGELHIKWDRKENLVYMTGPAKIVFEGEVDPYSI